MTEYRVTWTLEVDAFTPLNAAKAADKWLREADTDWVFMEQVWMEENGDTDEDADLVEEE